MQELVAFLQAHGIALTLIAVLGIVILGVLKYKNLFSKIDENNRHYLYLFISVGFSVLASVVYLGAIGQFDAQAMFVTCGAIYTLNQTFYNIFKITPVNELAVKLLNMFLDLFRNKIKEKNEDKKEE